MDFRLSLNVLPGNIKMKKALIPPITLMTSLMSGTHMAMRRVTAIQRIVRTTRHRHSNTDVIMARLSQNRNICVKITDLWIRHNNNYATVCMHAVSCGTVYGMWLKVPAQQQYYRIDCNDRNSKEQPSNNHHYIISRIWHQDIWGYFPSECKKSKHTCSIVTMCQSLSIKNIEQKHL